MKLLVAGSRSIPNDNLDRQQLWHIFDNLSYSFDIPFSSIIEGEAPGVDREARAWAEFKGYEVESYPANWEGLGKRAGFVRNKTMVNECDRAIIVWDGFSLGTDHTIRMLEDSLKPFVLAVRPFG